MGQQRLLALSGIAFVALALVAVVAIGGDTPGTDASAGELASFYGDNAIRQGAGAFVLAAAALFVVLFGVGLATRFADAGRSPAVTSTGSAPPASTITCAHPSPDPKASTSSTSS